MDSPTPPPDIQHLQVPVARGRQADEAVHTELARRNSDRTLTAGAGPVRRTSPVSSPRSDHHGLRP
jgi:hypothetical protein